MKVASSIALTVAPLSGNTVTLAPLISTFFKGLFSEVPMGLTVSNVHVDSSLLSDEVSDFRSPPYANSFVALTSCLLLQKFAKWFLFPHRLHCLPKAGHFLGPPWCGHC